VDRNRWLVVVVVVVLILVVVVVLVVVVPDLVFLVFPIEFVIVYFV
jgi:hypothetical protein